jgi:hypothetical protein
MEQKLFAVGEDYTIFSLCFVYMEKSLTIMASNLVIYS